MEGFDRLIRPERLALLAQVGKGLHDRGEPCAALTACNEAAVAAVFAQVRCLVSVEIDAQRSGFGWFSRDRARRPRERVLTAIRQVEPVREADLPKATSTDYSWWSDLIRTMLFRIPDDIDYLAADVFLEMAPSRSRSMKALLGIPEDHFSAVPCSPTRRQLEVIRADLRRICGRPKAWLSPQSSTR